MTVLADVWVPGVPRTKGSVMPQGKRVYEPPQSIRWQRLIADAVRRWRRERGLTSASEAPCEVRCVCFVPLPVNQTQWTIGATHRGAGDVDKLARNALDGIGSAARDAAKNGGAIVDDVQVFRLDVQRYAAQAHCGGPGMHLTVREIDQAELERYYALAVAVARRVVA